MDVKGIHQKKKLAWIVTAEDNIRKSISPPSVCRSAFYIEMRPILMTFGILGRLTFGFNKEGKMESRLISLRCSYSILLYLFLSYLATTDLIALKELLKTEKDFMRSVMYIVNFTILTTHFVRPLLNVLESGRICHFFNIFADYQETYENWTNDVLMTIYNRKVRLLLYASPFAVTGVVTYERTIFFNVVWYHLIVYAGIFLLLNCYLIFWTFSLWEIGNCAVVLNEKLKKSLGKLCDAEDIYRYRILWFKLNKVLESAGGSLPFTMMKMTALNYFSFVVAAYALIYCLIQGITYEAFQFLGIMCVTWFFTACTMEAGHYATQKVDKIFFDTLMETNVAFMDDKCLKEFNLFVTLMSKSSSVVTLIGYVPANRTTIAALIASTVTYLIVLIQFNQSPANTVH